MPKIMAVDATGVVPSGLSHRAKPTALTVDPPILFLATFKENHFKALINYANS
jgi:hypothetical protein